MNVHRICVAIISQGGRCSYIAADMYEECMRGREDEALLVDGFELHDFSMPEKDFESMRQFKKKVCAPPLCSWCDGAY